MSAIHDDLLGNLRRGLEIGHVNVNLGAAGDREMMPACAQALDLDNTGRIGLQLLRPEQVGKRSGRMVQLDRVATAGRGPAINDGQDHGGAGRRDVEVQRNGRLSVNDNLLYL